MRSLVFVALLLATLCSFAQPDPDAVVKGLHGKVHSIRVEGSSDGSAELALVEQTFNPEGWLTEEKVYGINNQVMTHTIFKRSGARIIECDSTTQFPPEDAKRIVTSFEEHGFPSQRVTYSLDGTLRERMTVVYEETQIRELHYDANDKLVSTRAISTLHDPDSRDRHVEQQLNGKTESVTDIHKNGDETEMKRRVYKDGQVSSNMAIDITKAGSSTVVVDSDGNSWASTTRNHDSDESMNPDGSRMKSKFNDLGQKVEEDRYNADGKLTERTNFAYETDEHGNWTRRTTTTSGQPGSASVLVRTIAYY